MLEAADDADPQRCRTFENRGIRLLGPVQIVSIKRLLEMRRGHDRTEAMRSPAPKQGLGLNPRRSTVIDIAENVAVQFDHCRQAGRAPYAGFRHVGVQ